MFFLPKEKIVHNHLQKTIFTTKKLFHFRLKELIFYQKEYISYTDMKN